MPEEISAISAPDPFSMSTADLAAAFGNAQPATLTETPPTPEQPAPAAPAAPPTPEVTAPTKQVPVPPVATAPVTDTPPPAPAFDTAAFLREQFGVDQPDAIKQALESAKQVQTLSANQRTAEDVAFQKLLADPQAAQAFLRLQATDYKTLPAKELLAAQYAHDHPELPADLAAVEAALEYKAKYSAIDFEDADDEDVKTAKLRLDYATNAARSKMEVAKTAAREAVLSKQSAPEAEGPNEQEAQAQSAAWVQGVESIAATPTRELTYTVDGKELKLAYDNKSEAYKQAALDPVKFILDQVRPTGKHADTNYGRVADIVALLTQHGTLIKNAYAAGKASLGAVVPLDKAVNPAPAAPQAPLGNQNPLDALRSATPRHAAPQGLSY